jgi:hypothetical protein
MSAHSNEEIVAMIKELVESLAEDYPIVNDLLEDKNRFRFDDLCYIANYHINHLHKFNAG